MTSLASFLFTVMFLSLFAEVISGSFGLIIPFTAISVFYFSGLHGWKVGVFIGFFAGSALDLIYGRDFPPTPFIMMLVAGISGLWTVKGNLKSYSAHVFPGSILGLLMSAEILMYSQGIGIQEGLFVLSQAISTLLATMLLLPAFIWSADKASGFLGLDKYCNFKAGIPEKAERS